MQVTHDIGKFAEREARRLVAGANPTPNQPQSNRASPQEMQRCAQPQAASTVYTSVEERHELEESQRELAAWRRVEDMKRRLDADAATQHLAATRPRPIRGEGKNAKEVPAPVYIGSSALAYWSFLAARPPLAHSLPLCAH
jgi:hypothetical protein